MGRREPNRCTAGILPKIRNIRPYGYITKFKTKSSGIWSAAHLVGSNLPQGLRAADQLVQSFDYVCKWRTVRWKIDRGYGCVLEIAVWKLSLNVQFTSFFLPAVEHELVKGLRTVHGRGQPKEEQSTLSVHWAHGSPLPHGVSRESSFLMVGNRKKSVGPGPVNSRDA